MADSASQQPPQPTQLHPTFALPVELRTASYQYILNPSPGQTKTLYHDLEHLHDRNLNLCVALLQVSRQTYIDAVPILYGDNHFKISLRGTPLAQAFALLHRNVASLDLLRRQPSTTNPSPPRTGLISPAALHALRHLELEFSYNSFWNSARNPRVTETGTLILDLLDILTRAPSMTAPVAFTKQRSLKITIYSNVEGKCMAQSPVGVTRGSLRPFASYVQDLVFLLEELRESTKVEVFEVVRQLVSPGGIVVRQVNVEDLLVSSS